MHFPAFGYRRIGNGFHWTLSLSTPVTVRLTKSCAAIILSIASSTSFRDGVAMMIFTGNLPQFIS
jgi:hypothetical protein